MAPSRQSLESDQFRIGKIDDRLKKRLEFKRGKATADIGLNSIAALIV
jgi:hypothetical protein